MMDMVVCVGENYRGGVDEWGNCLPAYRQVYSVRATVIDPADGSEGLLLFEIVNSPKPCAPDGRLGERAFHVKDFRPVKPTDISDLTKLVRQWEPA